MNIIIPKRGQYLLTSDWVVDLDDGEDDFQHCHGYERWREWMLDPWVKRGAVQVDKTKIAVPRGTCVTLDAIRLSSYYDTITFKFHRKYNATFHGGRMDLLASTVMDIPAVYLDSQASTEHAKKVKKA